MASNKNAVAASARTCRKDLCAIAEEETVPVVCKHVRFPKDSALKAYMVSSHTMTGREFSASFYNREAIHNMLQEAIQEAKHWEKEQDAKDLEHQRQRKQLSSPKILSHDHGSSFSQLRRTNGIRIQTEQQHQESLRPGQQAQRSKLSLSTPKLIISSFRAKKQQRHVETTHRGLENHIKNGQVRRMVRSQVSIQAVLQEQRRCACADKDDDHSCLHAIARAYRVTTQTSQVEAITRAKEDAQQAAQDLQDGRKLKSHRFLPAKNHIMKGRSGVVFLLSSRQGLRSETVSVVHHKKRIP